MTVQPAPAGLRTIQGIPVPLEEVEIRAQLRDLLAEVTVVQAYRNGETVPIEAVYTFPLPLEGVLLDVEVKLDERVLHGRVVGRAAAERAYEAAIDAGDAAIMIERPAPDLYTMNVGNLLPGACARVSFRYAVVLRRQRGHVRFLHPMTIAPRYGRSPLQPHQAPESSLLAENAARVEVEILGPLAQGPIGSPSHEIEIERSAGRAVVRPRTRPMTMDRDFVLDIEATQRLPATVWCEPDPAGGFACLAILQPDLPAQAEAAPRDLKIVVDCSGSMQGDSIAQARIAVQRILAALRPQDRFNVVLFGSHSRPLFGQMVPGDETHVGEAQQLLAELEANMGGTEMAAALSVALQFPARNKAGASLVLITDGALADTQRVIAAARVARHRLFTVGVGSAVAGGLLQQLAHATGGACELVTPREDMAERIFRHFRRIDQGGARLKIDWPAGAVKAVGADEPVFAGDTVAIGARFASTLEGEARFMALLADGNSVVEKAAVVPADMPADSGTIARLVAARELFELGCAIDAAQGDARTAMEQEAAALGVRYQLLSPWTNWLLTVAQDNASGELPALRKVQQTLAAGWHGMGTVNLFARWTTAAATPSFEDSAQPAAPMPPAAQAPAGRSDRMSRTRKAEPAGFEEVFPDFNERPRPGDGLLARLTGRRSLPPLRIDDLERLPGVSAETIAELRRLVAEGLDEAKVVAAFLRLLGEGRVAAALDRQTLRAIRRLSRELSVPDSIVRRARTRLSLSLLLEAEHRSDSR